MKSLLIFAALLAFASTTPVVPVIASHFIASPAVSAPLLEKVEGQAPASTVHAVHAKVVPQVISYHVPAPIVSAPVISSPVISAYTYAAPIVSHSSYRIVY